MNTVRRADSLEPLADADGRALVHRRLQGQEPGPLEADPRHRGRHHARPAISAAAPRSWISTLRAALPAVRVPVLVVCGADDPGTPASENRRLAGLVPGARYEEIAGMRHFPNVEAPDAFNRIMLGWLEQHKRAR